MKADSLYAWKRKNNALLNAVYTLKPKETKQYTKKINWNKQRYLKSHDIEFDRYQILQLYMAMGGIPHYLKEIEEGKSAIQNAKSFWLVKI